jgi:hypothetical protein
MDDLGLVKSVDGFGQSVVVAVADAADGRFNARLGQPLAVANADVLGGFKRSSRYLNEGSFDGCS